MAQPSSRVVAQAGIGERRRHQPGHDQKPDQIVHVETPQKPAVSETRKVLPAILPVPSCPLLKLGRR